MKKWTNFWILYFIIHLTKSLAFLIYVNRGEWPIGRVQEKNAGNFGTKPDS